MSVFDFRTRIEFTVELTYTLWLALPEHWEILGRNFPFPLFVKLHQSLDDFGMFFRGIHKAQYSIERFRYGATRCFVQPCQALLRILWREHHPI